MAVSEDTIRLVMQVAGQETIENLGKSVENYRALLVALTEQLKRGEITTDEFVVTQARYSRALDQQMGLLNNLRKTQEQATTATTAGTKADEKAADAIEKKGKAAKKGGSDIGGAALEASRAIEDLQYGLGGVINNVPNLVMRLGGTAGLTAAISLTAVAINVLVNNWSKLTALFENTDGPRKVTDEMDRLQKRIEELEAKKIKLSVDTLELDAAKEKLDKLKAAQAAFDAAGKTRSHYQKESGEGISDMLANDDERALRDRMKAVQVQANERNSATIKEAKQELARLASKKAEAEKWLATTEPGSMYHTAAERDINIYSNQMAAAEHRINEARKPLEEEAERQVGEALRGAKEGEATGRADLAKRLRDIKEEDLASGVEHSSPEQLQLNEMRDEALQNSIDEIKAVNERNKKHKERREKAARNAKTAKEAAEKPIKEAARNAVHGELDTIQRGSDFGDEAEKLYREIKAKGGKTADQYAALKTALRKRFQDALTQGGFNTQFSADQINSAAEAAANQAKQHAEAKDKTAITTAQHKQKQDQADAKKNEEALEKGLGDQFLAVAEQQYLEIGQIRNRGQRGAALQRFQVELQKRAREKLVGDGMSVEDADKLARGADDLIAQDTRRQLDRLRAQNHVNEQQARGQLHAILGANAGAEPRGRAGANRKSKPPKIAPARGGAAAEATPVLPPAPKPKAVAPPRPQVLPPAAPAGPTMQVVAGVVQNQSLQASVTHNLAQQNAAMDRELKRIRDRLTDTRGTMLNSGSR